MVEAAVSTAEMAALLGVSTDQLRGWVHAGEVPYIDRGRNFGFQPTEVFAARRRVKERVEATGRSNRSRAARRKVW